MVPVREQGRLDPSAHVTHYYDQDVYWRINKLSALQLLLGHTKLESTVRYFGIEVGDAPEIEEQTEV